MASPQPDKFTRLSNELLRAIYRFPFSGAQLRVILTVARFSYGWSRKVTDQMGYRIMSKETDMPRSSVQLALTILVEMGVLFRDDLGRWGINKDYEKWAERVQPTVPGGGTAHRTGGASGLAERVQPTVPGGASGLTAYKEKEKRKERKKTDCEVRTLTPQQKLIRYFKESKGVNADDKDWDRRHFCGRLIKEATEYLRAFDGDVKTAGEYLLVIGEEWKDLPDWSLPGARSKAGRDPRLNGEINGCEHSKMVDALPHGDGRRSRITSGRALARDALKAIETTAMQRDREAVMEAHGENRRRDSEDFA